MIEAHDLSRRYGDFTAVDGISFSVDEGEIVGILGPNGAGKTTTIRMITGFLPPSAGRVTVAGHDLVREPRRARRQIGYLPEHVSLYPEMRVGEYLAYRGRLVGMPRAHVPGAVDEAVDQALLEKVRGQTIRTLSKGYRQRVGLAAAILHKPRVLVLDEPTVGLDPRQIIAIRELIRDLGSRRTLLLSTHILPEVELLCDRVLIIDEGRIVAEGTPAELARESRSRRRLRVGLRDAGDAAAARLGALPGVEGVIGEMPAARRPPAPDDDGGEGTAGEGTGGEAAATPPGREVTYHLEVALGADPREEIFRLAVDAGWALVELAEETASLEDVFVRLTTRDAPVEEAAEEVAEEAGVETAPRVEDVPEAGPPAAETSSDRREEPS